MRTKYDDLIDEFPRVFRLNAENKARGDGKVNNPYRPIELGIECGPGWYDLIRECVVEIDKILETLDDSDLKNAFTVSQVKEKFGELRFYTDWATVAMDDAIKVACRKSATTCEWCGAPGKLRDGRWLRTLCDTCAGKSKEKGSDV